MAEKRADAVGHFLGEAVLETARARFDEVIANVEDIDEQPFSQPRATHDRLGLPTPRRRQFDHSVRLIEIPRLSRAVEERFGEHVLAVLHPQELPGRHLLVPFRLLVEHGEDFVEKLQ